MYVFEIEQLKYNIGFHGLGIATKNHKNAQKGYFKSLVAIKLPNGQCLAEMLNFSLRKLE